MKKRIQTKTFYVSVKVFDADNPHLPEKEVIRIRMRKNTVRQALTDFLKRYAQMLVTDCHIDIHWPCGEFSSFEYDYRTGEATLAAYMQHQVELFPTLPIDQGGMAHAA